jgi:uncharacterized protein YecT (DUF1311 family)
MDPADVCGQVVSQRVWVLEKDKEANRHAVRKDSDIYVHVGVGTCNADVISKRNR